MSPSEISAKQILDAIQRVPVQRWGEVLQAIKDLEELQSPTAPAVSPVRTGTDLRDSELIGIWADRTDISSGQEFARELRRQAEQRNTQGRTHAAGHGHYG